MAGRDGVETSSVGRPSGNEEAKRGHGRWPSGSPHSRSGCSAAQRSAGPAVRDAGAQLAGWADADAKSVGTLLLYAASYGDLSDGCIVEVR